MSKMLEIVRHYSLNIRNGRKPDDAFEHLKSELVELRDELGNGGTGVDGVKGEVMDVINCALDILFLVHPEVSLEELDAIMEAKCAKWVRKYATDDHEIVTPEMPSGSVLIQELHEAGLSDVQIGEMASIEPNSVRRILDGSMSFRAVQTRLNAILPTLREASEGKLQSLVLMMDVPDSKGATLGDILREPVVDLTELRRYIAEVSEGTGSLKTAALRCFEG
jgi:hypothetical protein